MYQQHSIHGRPVETGDSPSSSPPGRFKSLLPPRETRFISSFIINLLVISMGLLMLSDDLPRLQDLVGSTLVRLHLGFRLLTLTGSATLLYRAWKGRTTHRDFEMFLLLGMLYAGEGTLFNIDYYFAFVQIMVGCAWLVPTDPKRNYLMFAAAGIAYGLFHTAARTLGQVGAGMAVSWSYDSIPTVVVTVTALGCVAARSMWQQSQEKRIAVQMQRERRLADLGDHLTLISDEYKKQMESLKLGLYELRRNMNEHAQADYDKALRTLERLLTMQHFVSEIGSAAADRAREIKGHYLLSFIRTLLGDLTSNRQMSVQISGDEEATYRCVPSALAYALLHCVVARSKALEAQDANEPYRAGVNVGLDSEGNMYVDVEDNAPRLPLDLMGRVADAVASDPGLAEKYGDYLRMYRYVTLQNGYSTSSSTGASGLRIVIPQKSQRALLTPK